MDVRRPAATTIRIVRLPAGRPARWCPLLCALAAGVVVAGCGGQAQPTAAEEEGSDLVRARYTVTVMEDGQPYRQEYDVIADGDRRLRFAFVGGGEAERDQRRGSWTAWDGQVLLTYDPASEPAYNRIEEPAAGQRPTYVLIEGSDDFIRACPDARRLRTHALLGRTAVRYACGASSGQDPMEARSRSSSITALHPPATPVADPDVAA